MSIKIFKSMLAIASVAVVIASCSKSLDMPSPDNTLENQKMVYSEAFKKEFGTPASNQNWGFGSFSMEEVTKPEGSPDIPDDAAGSRTITRAVATEVTKTSKKQYQSAEEVLALETAVCYFYLRVDNKIMSQELNGVQGYATNMYYPKTMDLGNGVKDSEINTDNTGSIIISKWEELGLSTKGGLTYATDDQPIPETIFEKVPTFETMALHIPDAEKAKLVGSVEAFNSDNYKIFWYVAKWQASDKAIHIDGVVVPKNQVTVNIPEYKKRIIVEDLKGNINASTVIDGSDFDYNDVVFDAITWKLDGKTHLKIIVRAAGGQMPIYVHGKEIHDGIGYMFNTANPNYDFGKVLIENEIIEGADAETFDFNSIDVVVDVNGVKTTAASNIGEAPEKIAVGVDYKWCKEKQNIKDAYPRFTEYVGNKSVTDWWK